MSLQNRFSIARPMFVTLLVSMFALLASACVSEASPEVDPDDSELVLGRGIYISNCSSCHRPTGSGGVGTQLNNGALTRSLPDVADQRAVLVEGRGTMPSFSDRLSDEEIDAVVRYTREVIAEVVP